MEKGTNDFATLAPLEAGDRVAVLSPAGDAASHFPWVLDRGLQRLRDEFELVPVEFPTTRQRNASPELRAQDVNEAFKDPTIKAIFTTLGGNDQVRILPFLDADLIKNNPKPFFGYSDNSNIIQYLWNLKMPAYYGGALMTQFAMQGQMFPLTHDSLRRALFEKGTLEVAAAESFTDIDLDWADENNLQNTRELEPNEGWYWDGDNDAEGRLWGGCVETLIHYMAAGQPLPSFGDEKIVIYLESAENLPDAWIVKTLLGGLGERGMLKNAAAILVGRPKAWYFDKQLSPEARKDYRTKQRKAVVAAVRRYRSDIPVIQNMDFGHTDPQIIVPSGNLCRVNSLDKRIYFDY